MEIKIEIIGSELLGNVTHTIESELTDDVLMDELTTIELAEEKLFKLYDFAKKNRKQALMSLADEEAERSLEVALEDEHDCKAQGSEGHCTHASHKGE
jgi:hypothetical protein